MIRNAAPGDFAAIAEIYNHYIANTVVTFEVEPVTAEGIRARVESVTHKFPWLVLESASGVAGYAYANRWQERAAYRYTAETSVYVAAEECGQGYGTLLYDELLKRLAGLDLRALVAGITLPNTASVALHERFGFKKVAHYEQVGNKFDQWLDVGYWQCVQPETPNNA